MEQLQISQIIEIKGLKEFYTINKQDDDSLRSVLKLMVNLPLLPSLKIGNCWMVIVGLIF